MIHSDSSYSLNKQLKIMHIIIGLNLGGAENMLCRLVINQHINNPALKSCVVSLTDAGKLGKFLEKEGIDVYTLNFRLKTIIHSIFKLKKLLNFFKPDIVQTWMVHADLLGGLIARWYGVRGVIWGVRTTDYSVESMSTRLLRWVCARLSTYIPDRIICAAEASRIAQEKAGYDSNRMIVIQNGFDSKMLQKQMGRGASLREILGLSAEIKIIGSIGRYNPAKDYSNFIEAAKIVATNHSSCRFLMIGREINKNNSELMSLLYKTGYFNHFILLGERSDPAVCLDAMDIFVLSSCTEGFPVVLGEAMCMGKPCVSTNVGDASILLGETGRVVPPRNPVALANGISELLNMTSESRKNLGLQAQERIQKYFTINKCSENFYQVYQEIISDNHKNS